MKNDNTQIATDYQLLKGTLKQGDTCAEHRLLRSCVGALRGMGSSSLHLHNKGKKREVNKFLLHTGNIPPRLLKHRRVNI